MVECRYYGACRYASGNCSNGGDDAPDCEDFVPMPDVDALRRLADELDSPGYGWVSSMRRGIARRIREALGAVE